MLIDIPYDRTRATAYAKKWALSRNPLFFDFTGNGGNCTNFVSQAIFAGCSIMNYTPTFGWYYRSESDRAPAWTGVDELHDFLIGLGDFSTNGDGTGPYGRPAREAMAIELGDVIQLQNSLGQFYHSLIISGFTPNDILVCAQSDNALDRPLSTYNYSSLRIIHIDGARLFFDSEQIYEEVYNALSLPE